MKTTSFAIFLCGSFYLSFFNVGGMAQAPIVPKKWLSTFQFEGVEARLQKQLDSGVDMGGTAWDMAEVKDAELLIAYVSLYDSLPANQRPKLLQD